ncbi:hypothetical protein ACHAPI_006891 [Fusarium lateritium]
MALLLWHTISWCLRSFLEPSSLNESQHSTYKLFEYSVAKIAEQVFAGRNVPSDELSRSEQFRKLLESLQSEFLSEFAWHLASRPITYGLLDLDTKMEIMEQQVSRLMASLTIYFSLIFEAREENRACEDLREAFQGFIAE